MKLVLPQYTNWQLPQEAYQLQLPVNAPSDSFLIYCPSKKCRIGDRVYPFAGLQHTTSYGLSSARWRVDGGGWNAVSVGTYTDLLQAIRFVSTTVTEFGTATYEIEITDAASRVITAAVDVVCTIFVKRSRSSNVSESFFPFSGIDLGDETYIDAIQYEVTGPTTVAKQAVPRTVFFSGTHTGGNGVAILTDSTKEFTTARIAVDVDIVKNVTDVSEGVITAFSGTDITATLGGGTDDWWDNGDSYQIVQGGDFATVLRNFSTSLASEGFYVFILYVTDTSANDAIVRIVVPILVAS